MKRLDLSATANHAHHVIVPIVPTGPAESDISKIVDRLGVGA